MGAGAPKGWDMAQETTNDFLEIIDLYFGETDGTAFADAQEQWRRWSRFVDLLSFEQKWVALQESITGKLPLIPVYSNVYFDFFTRELHEYSVTEAVTWAEAIVKSYMSDMEELKEGEEEALIHGLHDMAEVYRVEK